MRLRLLLFACLLGLLGVGAAVALAEPKSSVTIDFSAVGIKQDYMNPLFFKSDGIRFGDSYYIAWIQGDDAIGGIGAVTNTPVTATFMRPVTRITVSFALAWQGTGQYTLTAYSASGRVIAAKTMIVTQSSASFPGYVSITDENLQPKAKSFAFYGEDVGYGINAISYTYD
jgi:hypothetical protein